MQKRVSKNSCKKLQKTKTIVKNRYFRFQTWDSQNVFNEDLLAWFKFQTKILNRSGVCVQGKSQKYIPPSPLLCKDKRIRDLNIGNLILCVNSGTVSYLILYVSILQNTIDIIAKCNSYFITKCDSYYKMRLLLQIATVRFFYIILPW